MIDAGEKPLVTFYVIAYNQARFIREAVEGALAQTYSPLEIVLSDDCSTDGTFAIMEELVAGYSGPHKIILNRNDRNLGLSEHVNRIMALATGELVVAADGDDVSHPQRTERCVQVWLENDKPAALVTTVKCIDAAGNPSRDGARWFAQFLPAENESQTACLRRFSREGSPRLISCSAAWTKQLFESFGPMPPGLWFEDDVITLRAWLLDRIVFIKEALVSYREHDSNLFNRVDFPLNTPQARQQAEEETRTQARRRRESLRSYLADLDFALRQQSITREIHQELTRRVETDCAFYRIIEDWWNVSWPSRLGLFLYLALSGRTREVRWCSTRLLPYPLFLRLGSLWSRSRAGISSVLPASCFNISAILESLLPS